MRMAMPRALSHSISLGTRSAAGEFGFEIIPTVLMMGIQEKLLVPFGAGDRALRDLRFESDFAHRPFDSLASRLMQFGLANDATPAHQALAYLKLRFDQYNHLPRRP